MWTHWGLKAPTIYLTTATVDQGEEGVADSFWSSGPYVYQNNRTHHTMHASHCNDFNVLR